MFNFFGREIKSSCPHMGYDFTQQYMSSSNTEYSTYLSFITNYSTQLSFIICNSQKTSVNQPINKVCYFHNYHGGTNKMILLLNGYFSTF